MSHHPQSEPDRSDEGPGRAPSVGGRPSESAAGSRVDFAYEELRRRILDAVMPPGYTALEQELAQILGVSRTPVREALIRLAKDGLVEVRPRRGMRVLPLRAKDMRDMYDIVIALESMAAERVAQRGLSAEKLAAFDQALDAMDAALAADDLEAWAAADESFHELLLEACDNQRLTAILANLRGQSHHLRMITLHRRQRPTASNYDHRVLVDCLRRRDPHAAREVHRLHHTRAGDALVDIVRRLEEESARDEPGPPSARKRSTERESLPPSAPRSADP